MIWYNAVDDLPDLIHRNEVQENWVRKTKVIESVQETEGLSEIAQYFVSAQVLFDENSYHQIIIRNQGILEIVQEHLMPHYNKIRGFYKDDQLAEVRLSDLKTNSQKKYLELLKQREIHPFVHGLRGERKHDVSSRLSVPAPLTWVKLNAEEIRGSSEQVSDSFWDFLSMSLSTDSGVVFFMPTMWSFEEELLNNAAIQYLSRVCEELYLAVDQTDSTIRNVVVIPSKK